MENEELEEKAVLIIEESKSALLVIIKNGILKGYNKRVINAQGNSICNGAYMTILELLPKATKRLRELARDSKRGLIEFFRYNLNQEGKYLKESKMPQAKVLLDELNDELDEQEKALIEAIKENRIIIGKNTNEAVIIDKSNPSKYKWTSGNLAEDQMQIEDYSKKVKVAMKLLKGADLKESEEKFREDIQKELNRMANRTLTIGTKQPSNRRVSLRNIAEMTIRRMAQDEEINTLKKNGVKYVLCSQHMDASKDRCAVWQGLLFELDVSPEEDFILNKPFKKPQDYKPTIVDGMKCYKLSWAMKNGLFSYNCRHRLIVYERGMYVPKQFKVNALRQENKRRIDTKMREYERLIRDAKYHVLMAITPEERKRWNAQSKKLQLEYQQFAKGNNRIVGNWRASISYDEQNLI